MKKIVLFIAIISASCATTKDGKSAEPIKSVDSSKLVASSKSAEPSKVEPSKAEAATLLIGLIVFEALFHAGEIIIARALDF